MTSSNNNTGAIFDSDFLNVIANSGNALSTGEIAKIVKCRREIAQKFLTSLKNRSLVRSERVAGNRNEWHLCKTEPEPIEPEKQQISKLDRYLVNSIYLCGKHLGSEPDLAYYINLVCDKFEEACTEAELDDSLQDLKDYFLKHNKNIVKSDPVESTITSLYYHPTYSDSRALIL